MKRLIRWATGMYPRAWRQRYGEEFQALLDDTDADARVAFNVLMGAVRMQIQWRKTLAVGTTATALVCAAAWCVGQRPYVTAGRHQVFYMDSNAGALVGLLVCLIAAVMGAIALGFDHSGNSRAAGRAGRACGGLMGLYVAVVVLVALLTPRKIVSIGDGYCYDTWCIGIQKVRARPQGVEIVYTAEVRIFSDANRVTARRDKDFLYALDERGRRFPLVPDATVIPADVIVNPGESLKTKWTFRAPADARELYLTGDHAAMPWVYLYLGSDISPLHRCTLLRVL